MSSMMLGEMSVPVIAESEGDWVALVVVVLAGVWKYCVGTTVIIK